MNKPPGLRSIADGYDASLPHLHGWLSERYGRLWVVHRLDKDTSGVILFARNAEAHRNLNGQFERRETCKQYHALVCGSPDWEAQDIRLPLKVNGDRKHRTVIDGHNGREAFTSVQVLRRFSQYTLLSAQPHTGYTHQIRAHLAALGFPLLADPLYHSLKAGDRARVFPQLPIQRTALHAARIEFTHPLQHTPCHIDAPYPDDFEQAIRLLEKI